MYLIINHFAFEYPKENLSDEQIIETFEYLGKLFIDLKKLHVDLITHSTLSETRLNQKSIRDFIKILDNDNIKKALTALIGKIKPICSNTDLSFEEIDHIAFNNCKEESEEIDICYTFLSCALYHLDPILTIDSLCNKEQFLRDKIKIICDDNSYELQNYKLTPYEELIKKIKEYQSDRLNDQLNLINNWNDYKEFVNANFKYCKITNHCVECLTKRFSYTNSYSIQVRKKISRMNNLIEQNNGQIMTMDFASLGLGTPESETRINSLKASHKGIVNYVNDSIDLNWHDYIQKDFRIYFDKCSSYISFVYFEKKMD